MQFELCIAGKCVPADGDPADGHDERAANQSRKKHDLYNVSGKNHESCAIAREVGGFPALGRAAAPILKCKRSIGRIASSE